MPDEIKDSLIIPTAETIQRNKALIRCAISKCADWFVEHREYFIFQANIIGQRNLDWENEYERLNPQKPPTYKDPKTGIWYPDKKKKFPLVEEPSLFNPIHACYGKPRTQQRPLTRQTERITRFSIPDD